VKWPCPTATVGRMTVAADLMRYIQQTKQIKRYSLLNMVNPVLLLLDGNEKKYN
jgi:hypothetical protein